MCAALSPLPRACIAVYALVAKEVSVLPRPVVAYESSALVGGPPMEGCNRTAVDRTPHTGYCRLGYPGRILPRFSKLRAGHDPMESGGPGRSFADNPSGKNRKLWMLSYETMKRGSVAPAALLDERDILGVQLDEDGIVA